MPQVLSSQRAPPGHQLLLLVSERPWRNPGGFAACGRLLRLAVQGGGDGLEARGDGAAGEPSEVVRRRRPARAVRRVEAEDRGDVRGGQASGLEALLRLGLVDVAEGD